MDINYKVISVNAGKREVSLSYTSQDGVMVVRKIVVRPEDLVGSSAEVNAKLHAIYKRSAPVKRLAPPKPVAPKPNYTFDLNNQVGLTHDTNTEEVEEEVALFENAGDPEALRVFKVRKAYKELPAGARSKERGRIIREAALNPAAKKVR